MSNTDKDNQNIFWRKSKKKNFEIPLENYVVDFKSTQFSVYEIKDFSLTTNFCKVKIKNQ